MFRQPHGRRIGWYKPRQCQPWILRPTSFLLLPENTRPFVSAAWVCKCGSCDHASLLQAVEASHAGFVHPGQGEVVFCGCRVFQRQPLGVLQLGLGDVRGGDLFQEVKHRRLSGSGCYEAATVAHFLRHE